MATRSWGWLSGSWAAIVMRGMKMTTMRILMKSQLKTRRTRPPSQSRLLSIKKPSSRRRSQSQSRQTRRGRPLLPPSLSRPSATSLCRSASTGPVQCATGASHSRRRGGRRCTRPGSAPSGGGGWAAAGRMGASSCTSTWLWVPSTTSRWSTTTSPRATSTSAGRGTTTSTLSGWSRALHATLPMRRRRWTSMWIWMWRRPSTGGSSSPGHCKTATSSMRAASVATTARTAMTPWCRSHKR
mmetsp:Transcript_20776/g.59277  ORF Transcript_20776/g.59277 Transcript_20776/m.59277 type:complete len:241 (+) Transcript_20776:444-1166(+)